MRLSEERILIDHHLEMMMIGTLPQGVIEEEILIDLQEVIPIGLIMREIKGEERETDMIERIEIETEQRIGTEMQERRMGEEKSEKVVLKEKREETRGEKRMKKSLELEKRLEIEERRETRIGMRMLMKVGN